MKLVSKRQIERVKAQLKNELEPEDRDIEINIVSLDREGEKYTLKDFRTGEIVETLTQEEYEDQVQAEELLELEWENEE